jgi:hypothetical protein
MRIMDSEVFQVCSEHDFGKPPRLQAIECLTQAQHQELLHKRSPPVDARVITNEDGMRVAALGMREAEYHVNRKGKRFAVYTYIFWLQVPDQLSGLDYDLHARFLEQRLADLPYNVIGSTSWENAVRIDMDASGSMESVSNSLGAGCKH